MRGTDGGASWCLCGSEAALAQWRFNCAIHNLLMLHRAGGLELARAG
jgi:hypothetical protein